MSTQDYSRNDNLKHSEPIPIVQSPFRRRSASVSSASSGSASSASELPTPVSPSGSRVSIPSPGSSPILSYFLAQSPTAKTPGGTFPLSKRFSANPPVFEEDESGNAEIPAAAHARRASASVAGRFMQPPAIPVADPRQERGTGVLRRLSLSSATFVRPTADRQSPPLPSGPPPNSAVSSTDKSLPFSSGGRPRRAATLNVGGGQPRRAPSPMGERILKGHFDGFN
ncbi:hypothetical protein HGRIS_003401 [Hohenbuehelia grisea]|uniref:Uncharacterized protein n=1 Tax=Hohenbuehelia grisea TaxID=104357 RepID=A0ABR3JGZ0_9AGAR